MTQFISDRRQKIWVIFSGETEIKFLKFLKHGFRHCFVVLNRNGQWVVIDPLSHKLEIELFHTDNNFYLPNWLETRGHIVVETEQNNDVPKRVLFSMLTCVQIVKRIIGIDDWRVMTPWQLYKYLTA